jgi:hypothetical protein
MTEAAWWRLQRSNGQESWRAGAVACHYRPTMPVARLTVQSLDLRHGRIIVADQSSVLAAAHPIRRTPYSALRTSGRGRRSSRSHPVPGVWLGVLLPPKPGELCERVRRMFEQAALGSVQRRHCVSWRAGHGEVGATLKVASDRLACRGPAKLLPLLQRADCGKHGLAESDTHTRLAARTVPAGGGSSTPRGKSRTWIALTSSTGGPLDARRQSRACGRS